MKILVLTSRYTANRDIIDEDFGRQVRLFGALKKLKHNIDFLCVDYKKLESKKLKLHGMDIYIEPFNIFYLLKFIFKLNKVTKKNNYDAIFVTSDPLWSIFGYYLSKKYNIKLIYDIQDNYETYKSFKLPFVRKFHDKVTKKADFVVCASNILKEDIKHLRKNNISVITNGFDSKLFKPLSKSTSRKKLGLPLKGKIISYIGTIQKLQGADILINTFKKLSKQIPNLYLVLAGRIDSEEKSKFDFSFKNIIYLGSISQKEAVCAINAADTMVIPYPPNKFTRVMLAPYKIVEYMACGKPIVVTDVGEMKNLIKNPKVIAKSGDLNSLATKIKYALKTNKANYNGVIDKFDWNYIAKKLDKEVLKNL